jgi:hypothetical protein
MLCVLRILVQTQTASSTDANEDEKPKFPSEEGSWKGTDNLAQFLRSVETDIVNQLTQNLESHAFDGKLSALLVSILFICWHSSDFEVLAEDDEAAVTQLHTLTYDFSFNNLAGRLAKQ